MRLKINIRTSLPYPADKVFENFNNDLLLALSPPGVKVRFIEVDDPIRKHGVVHLEVKLLGIIRQEWYNVITDYQTGSKESYFVDEGRRTPWPIRGWRHRHLVRSTPKGCEIVDEISFRPANIPVALLMYPFVWGQFAMRKPLYRKYFRKISAKLQSKPT